VRGSASGWRARSGCGLVGVLYVLDEPSIGLHARDNRRLLDTLERPARHGQHGRGGRARRRSDAQRRLDRGSWPGAGINGVGGRSRPLATILDNPDSLTGRYLSQELVVTSPNGGRRPLNGKWLDAGRRATEQPEGSHGALPLGLFICVAGVSGSGKFVAGGADAAPALVPGLTRRDKASWRARPRRGVEHVDKVINITQDPIGRTPRSNPATYVQVMAHIRELFALTPEAKARGYKAGRFSFNVKGGRCEACRGHGKKLVQMHFLPDVWVTCNVCKGQRFNRETLQIRYKGRNIAQVLDMDVDQARAFFGNVPAVTRILETLADVDWATSARAERYHAVGRRGPTGQVGEGAGARRHRGHRLYSG